MRHTGLVLATLATLAGAALAESDAPPAKAPQMSAEQRSKMADAHEKMAACLRSDRPLTECHDELMKSCDQTMGAAGCPMMGGMRHRGRGMQPPPPK